MPSDEQHEPVPKARGLDAESPTLTEGPEAATEGFGAGEERLLVGQNLGGRYQVVGRLGAGGMGSVWSATAVAGALTATTTLADQAGVAETECEWRFPGKAMLS